MARLTQKQIIENLQYALIEMSGKCLDYAAEKARLRSQVVELEKRPAVTPVDNRRKLTASDVRRLREDYRRTSMNQRELAEAYEVNPATVSRIVRGVYHARVR